MNRWTNPIKTDIPSAQIEHVHLPWKLTEKSFSILYHSIWLFSKVFSYLRAITHSIDYCCIALHWFCLFKLSKALFHAHCSPVNCPQIWSINYYVFIGTTYVQYIILIIVWLYHSWTHSLSLMKLKLFVVPFFLVCVCPVFLCLHLYFYFFSSSKWIIKWIEFIQQSVSFYYSHT